MNSMQESPNKNIIVKHIFNTPDSDTIDLLLFYQDNFNVSPQDVPYLFTLLVTDIIEDIEVTFKNYRQYPIDTLDKLITDYVINGRYDGEVVDIAITETVDDYLYNEVFALTNDTAKAALFKMKEISPWLLDTCSMTEDIVYDDETNDEYKISIIYSHMISQIVSEMVDMLPIIVLYFLLSGKECTFPDISYSKTKTGYILYLIYGSE